MLRLFWVLLLLPMSACFIPRDQVESRVVASGGSTQPRILRGSELSALLTGNVLTLRGSSGDANVTYGRDGSYRHMSSSGMSQGRYQIAGDQVCVTFASGNMRCDRYVGDGDNFAFLTDSGVQTTVVAVRPAG